MLLTFTCLELYSPNANIYIGLLNKGGGGEGGGGRFYFFIFFYLIKPSLDHPDIIVRLVRFCVESLKEENKYDKRNTRKYADKNKR